MFKIKCDDKYIYNPKSKKHLVNSPQLTEELNKSGKLTFNIPPNNVNILNLNGLTSKIELYNNKELEFAGRVIDTKDNFHNQKNVTVEGELSYLCDSIQRLKVYKCTPYDFYCQVIEEHNKQVTEDKRFKVGMFTIKDANDFIYRYTNYENTLEVLYDKLISSLGGYLRVRHVNGTRYLDLIESYNNTNTQVIEFKKNLLDFNKYIKLSEIRTAMIPLGYETDKTVTTDGETGTIKERLTILDYPDGEYDDIVKKGDIIYSKTGVAKYGYIYADKDDSTWNDVTVVENLFRKSVNTLKNLVNVTVTIELNAIDLNLIDVDIEKIKLGDMIRVVSKPHNLDSYFLVTKIVKNLQNPQNNKITLGDSLGSFTESINRTTNANKTTVEEIKHTTSNAVEEAKKTATDLLKDVTTGDIRFIDGSLYILDNPDIKKAKQVWKWNKNGWGYSSTGIDGEYGLAATMDGGIVADFITTGVLRSLQIINGDNFKLDEEGNLEIKANPNKKYRYTMLDIYLALAHISEEITLPDKLIDLYRCSSTGNRFTVADVRRMINIANGIDEPVNSVKANISITPKDVNETISLKIDDNLKTIIGLFQIYSYMIKTSQLFVGNGYTSDINNSTYGIRLNGQKKELTITDTNQEVVTTVDAGKVDAYNVFASSGGQKGYCIHGKGNAHTYMIDFTSYYGTTYFILFVDGIANPFPLINSVHVDSQQVSQIRHCASYLEYTVPRYGNFGVNGIFQSDTKLKDNIEDTKINALDIIKKLKHIQFDWKDTKMAMGKGHEEISYSANQIQDDIGMNIVYEVKQPEGSEFDSILQINDSRLTPLITKAIQEIDDKYNKKIIELENKISKLEGGNK